MSYNFDDIDNLLNDLDDNYDNANKGFVDVDDINDDEIDDLLNDLDDDPPQQQEEEITLDDYDFIPQNHQPQNNQYQQMNQQNSNNQYQQMNQPQNMQYQQMNQNSNNQFQQMNPPQKVPQPTPMKNNMMSSGPGKNMISSGPGKNMMSSGPGKNMMSSGPGKNMMSSGPGKNMISSGPGRGVPNSSGGVIRTGVDPSTLNQGYQGRGRSVATHTPTGQKIVHHGPNCVKCGEQIYGKIIGVNKEPHHPECVKCAVCNAVVAGQKFAFKDDKIYCERDYYNTFAPKCENCKGTITGPMIRCKGDKAEKVFHPDHFICVGCGTSLKNSEFKADVDGDPFCNVCFEKRTVVVETPEHMCGLCKKMIIGEYIRLNNGLYAHPEHFTCGTCKKPIESVEAREYKGTLYCEEHYKMLIVDLCFACRKPIIGRGLTAIGKTWHPEHFVCSHCNEPTSEKYFVEKGKPYCQKHYTQLFGKMCEKCGQAVVMNPIIDVESGRAWHTEHFSCSGCEKHLTAGTKCFVHNGKPLCFNCISKLPTEARRDVMNKLREKKKFRENQRKEKDQIKKESKKIEKERMKKDKENLKERKKVEKLNKDN